MIWNRWVIKNFEETRMAKGMANERLNKMKWNEIREEKRRRREENEGKMENKNQKKKRRKCILSKPPRVAGISHKSNDIIIRNVAGEPNNSYYATALFSNSRIHIPNTITKYNMINGTRNTRIRSTKEASKQATATTTTKTHIKIGL